MVHWTIPVFIYLYAGWTMAECSALGKNASNAGRMIGYGTLLLAWPLLMPWIPRRFETRKNKGLTK